MYERDRDDGGDVLEQLRGLSGAYDRRQILLTLEPLERELESLDVWEAMGRAIHAHYLLGLHSWADDWYDLRARVTRVLDRAQERVRERLAIVDRLETYVDGVRSAR